MQVKILIRDVGFFLSLILLATTSAVAATPQSVHEEPHVKVSILSNVEKIEPGTSAQVGILFNLEPNWHIYWKNPGDSGMPTSVSWKSESKIEFSQPEWPTPAVFKLGDLTSFGYEGQVLFTSTIKTLETVGHSGEIQAHVSWVLCNDECIPGETNLALKISDGIVPPTAVDAAAFQRETQDAPTIIAANTQVAVETGVLKIRVRGPGFLGLQPESVQFIPEAIGAIKASSVQKATIEDDGSLLISTPAISKFKPEIGSTLPGIIVAKDKTDTVRSYRITPTLATRLDELSGNEPAWGSPLLFALGSAFIGGLLLNLMPCVFPVFSLKVLALVEHAHSKSARMHMVVFVFGVMASFLALAAALCGLRSFGVELGWGFQFQSPRFVAAMVLITFMLGLNLAGLFEIGLSLQSKAGSVKVSNGYSGSFFSGVLATTLATPCTAPFMGSALAVALTAPLIGALGIFVALGLGMSLPYIIVAIWPKVARCLPRPGAWMESFKQALAFPMFATSVWLLGVLGAQQGAHAMTNCAVGLVLISLGCWILGRWGVPHRSWSVRVGARVAAVLVMIASVASAMPDSVMAEMNQATTIQKSGLAWEPFTEARLQDLQKSGKAFLVDFTASWCLVCSVNHHRVFERKEVIDNLGKSGLTLLRADWSTRDDNITKMLRTLGKSGVPLVVLFDGKNPPRQFDSLIDPDEFSSAVQGVAKLS